MEEQNVLLEEYKTLREELMLHIKLEKQILALSGTLYFLALTFFSKLETSIDYDLCSIILILLLTPLFIIYRVEVFSIAKIASYIEKCIEPKAKGLNWTRLHIRALPTHGKKCFNWRTFEISSSAVIGIYFLVLLALSWVFPIYLKGSFLSLFPTIVMVPFSLIYIYNFLILLNYRKYRKGWESIWEERDL